MGRVAVLVLNWNQPDLTAACVDSLLEARIAPGDIVLIDNGSTDGSAATLAARFPDARHLALPNNLGYTGGNNAGIRVALDELRAEFALVLNNDTLVPEGLVERLLAEMDAHPEAGIVQPRIVSFDGETIDNAGFLMDRNGATWPRGRGEPPTSRFDATGFFYASGACMLVRAEVLRTLGGFDERYFMYNDDVDFSWRARIAGWSIRLVDDARCLHAESTTAGASPRKIGVIWRNRFATLFKNYGARRAWTRAPWAILATGVFAALTAINQREWRFLPLYLKAVVWNVANLGSTLRERKRVQATRRVPDPALNSFFAPSVEWRMVGDRLRRRPRA